ncbi:hypothetical protein [Corynebacterium wankanglinii]|uniref:MuF-like minor capsid protein n=1 Tax=Corynebacterium wankanglinii TaxID=2735136 RepID=A0A838CGU0_9CORY|nr:hypothetical protein [Corynebacterium wankanglinii]MBA1834157.1 hypothetical protein [Corynebacterium wankanglinii]
MHDSWNVHRRQLDALVRDATQALLAYVRANPGMTSDDLQFIYEALVDQFGTGAAESALQTLEDSRTAAGVRHLPAPVRAGLPPPAQVAGTFGWAQSQAENVEELARVLAGPLGRLVRQPARQTVFSSTQAAGTRWARIPGGKACWFCLMLASRGAVYHSKESASLTSKRSATAPEVKFRNKAAKGGHRYKLGQAEGDKFHDNCDCQVVEVHDDAELPPIVEELYDEWVEVTWNDGLPGGSQLQRWKEHIAQTRPNGEAARPK